MWLKRSEFVMTTAEIWHCDGALRAPPGLRGGYPTASRLNRILEAIGIALWRYDAMTAGTGADGCR